MCAFMCTGMHAQMLARLDVMMGGRAAEELVFGHDSVTSGASSDIQQVNACDTHTHTRLQHMPPCSLS
jgi:ATP-dependent Zn protease